MFLCGNRSLPAFAFAILGLLTIAQAIGQSENPSLKNKVFLEHTAYAEIYSTFQSGIHFSEKIPFHYNYNIHQQLRPNLLFYSLKASINQWKLSAGAMAGDYVLQNLANEPKGWKNVKELFVTWTSKKYQKLSIDVGIMPSHIGFESPIGKNEWLLTRSVMADNSPYFETGLGLNYGLKNGNFTLRFLNGWQTIRPVNGWADWALGTAWNWSKNNWNFSWNTYWGTSSILNDSSKRTYNNFYISKSFSKNQSFIFGLDIGNIEKDGIPFKGKKQWLIAQWAYKNQLNTRWRLGARVEWINDRNRVILSGADPASSPRLFSASFLCEYHLNISQCIKLEWRNYLSNAIMQPWNNKSSQRITASWCWLINR